MMRMVMEVVMVLAVVGMMLFIMRVSKKENDCEVNMQDHDKENDQ
jgi:preprotein translocase subunit YajC